MSTIYKVNMSGVTVNMYSNPNNGTIARNQAMDEYNRLNEKYPDRLVEVIRVKSEVIAKSR